MELVEIEGLPLNERVYEEGGRYIRVRFSETTDELGAAERSMVRAFKVESVGCDAAGDVPDPKQPWSTQPGYFSEVRTVTLQAVADGKITIENELSAQLLTNATRSRALVVTHESLSWIPKRKDVEAAEATAVELATAEPVEAEVDAEAGKG